jgi:hypothetical protein
MSRAGAGADAQVKAEDVLFLVQESFLHFLQQQMALRQFALAQLEP